MLPALACAWTFETKPDAMGMGSVRTAYVTSSNSVRFGFPYQGAQRGILALRDEPGGTVSVIFAIERGQFMCKVDYCDVTIKFDEQEPQSVKASRSSDHSSSMVFLNDEALFIEAVKNAKRVRIQATFFQNGTRVFDFPIAKLGDWPAAHPPPTKRPSPK